VQTIRSGIAALESELSAQEVDQTVSDRTLKDKETKLIQLQNKVVTAPPISITDLAL